MTPTLHPLSCALCFTIILLLNLPAFAETAIKANPDYISSGISWTSAGIPSIKIGDIISFHRFLVGGMLEARNGKRFNQEILPNHNWRGIGKIEVALYQRPLASAQVSIATNVIHESAHATMGIREPTQKAYELIYDDVYRRMMLNSAGISGSFVHSGNQNTFSARVDYNFYFLSKNTPELAGPKLGTSHGVSLGIENKYRTRKNAVFYISIFDRLIFEGTSTDQGYVYTGNNSALASPLLTCPVIARTNTIVLKTGLSFSFGESHRETGLYGRVLYGNSYGFIDSRDTRLTTSIGVETSI
jgi:hypothetical protein